MRSLQGRLLSTKGCQNKDKATCSHFLEPHKEDVNSNLKEDCWGQHPVPQYRHPNNFGNPRIGNLPQLGIWGTCRIIWRNAHVKVVSGFKALVFVLIGVLISVFVLVGNEY